MFALFVRFAGSYTVDVIASTAFGLDINTKEDCNNQFVVMARKAFNFQRFSPAILVPCKCKKNLIIETTMGPNEMAKSKKIANGIVNDIIYKCYKM